MVALFGFVVATKKYLLQAHLLEAGDGKIYGNVQSDATVVRAAEMLDRKN